MTNSTNAPCSLAETISPARELAAELRKVPDTGRCPELARNLILAIERAGPKDSREFAFPNGTRVKVTRYAECGRTIEWRIGKVDDKQRLANYDKLRQERNRLLASVKKFKDDPENSAAPRVSSLAPPKHARQRFRRWLQYQEALEALDALRRRTDRRPLGGERVLLSDRRGFAPRPPLFRRSEDPLLSVLQGLDGIAGLIALSHKPVNPDEARELAERIERLLPSSQDTAGTSEVKPSQDDRLPDPIRNVDLAKRADLTPDHVSEVMREALKAADRAHSKGGKGKLREWSHVDLRAAAPDAPGQLGRYLRREFLLFANRNETGMKPGTSKKLASR